MVPDSLLVSFSCGWFMPLTLYNSARSEITEPNSLKYIFDSVQLLTTCLSLITSMMMCLHIWVAAEETENQNQGLGVSPN